MKFSAESFRDLVHGRRRGAKAACQRAGLWLLSQAYGAGAGARNTLYDWNWKTRHRVSIPVVSVGNLTLGGTGKTPCVEYVSRFYRDRDLRVAILSRGYGAGEGPNDEALVLEECLPDVPHLQGADRVQLARTTVEELESEVLVLDDGFQHRRLARALDLVLVDATDPWGAGYLFPRGLLRESARSLRRAGVVLLTRCDQAARPALAALRGQVERRAPGVVVAESTHRPMHLVRSDGATCPLETIGQRPVAAFCGIGNPEAFRRTLQDLQAEIRDFRTFPDHHAYRREDVEELENWAAQQTTECLVVTTQKDLVKLRLASLSGRALWALRIGLQVEAGREELDRKLLEAVQGPA